MDLLHWKKCDKCVSKYIYQCIYSSTLHPLGSTLLILHLNLNTHQGRIKNAGTKSMLDHLLKDLIHLLFHF